MKQLRLTATVCMIPLLAALLSGCAGKADRIESGLKKGAEFVRLADWDKANVEIRNVLQIDPKNAQAYFIAGQISEGKRDIQRAYGGYSKALELNPNHAQGKAALARIYLLAGDVTNAEKLTQEILAADSNSVGGRTLRAALMASRGDAAGATRLAQELLNNPKNLTVETSMLLAGLYSNAGAHQTALKVIDTALLANPTDLALLQVAAQVSSDPAADAGTAALAPGYYKRATQQAPKGVEYWNAWAAYHARRKELPQAEAVLRESMRALPDDSARTLTLMDFILRSRGPDEAAKAFLTAIADKPKEMKLRFGLVQLYRSVNRVAEAESALKSIIDLGKETPSAVAARSQLAAIRYGAGKLDEARTLVAEVLQANPRDGLGLELRGRMLLGEGKARDAVIDLRAASRDQPGSPAISGLLAQAHRAAGEPQLAREVLTEAVKFKPDSTDLRLLLAADMADSRDFKAAAAVLDEALKADATNLRIYDVKAALALAQKDTAGAEKVYRDLKVKSPKDPAVLLRLGQLSVQLRKFDVALKEYDAASLLAPNAPEPMLAAVGLLVSQRRFDEAHARIDTLLKAEPRNVLPHQLKGDVALAQGKAADAQSHYERMIELVPGLAAGYLNVARALAQQNKMDAVFATLDRGEKANPSDLSLPANKAHWLTRSGRYDDAIRTYEVLLGRAPDDDVVTNNLAYLLTEVKGDRKSLDRALELTSRFGASTNANYLDSLGWVRYKLGNYGQAVPLLERAVALAPDSPLLQLHLGMALHKQGDSQRSKLVLGKVIDSKANLPGLDEARRVLTPTAN